MTKEEKQALKHLRMSEKEATRKMKEEEIQFRKEQKVREAEERYDEFVARLTDEEKQGMATLGLNGLKNLAEKQRKSKSSLLIGKITLASIGLVCIGLTTILATLSLITLVPALSLGLFGIGIACSSVILDTNSQKFYKCDFESMARYYEEHADEMEKLRAEIEKAKAVEKKDAVDERLILKKLNRDYRESMKQ